MRKVNPLEPQKIITMIILLMSTCIKVSAQSPYAMFGDNSKMLEAKRESVPSIYRVGVQSTNGVNLYADFDMNKGLATLYDAEGNISDKTVSVKIRRRCLQPLILTQRVIII